MIITVLISFVAVCAMCYSIGHYQGQRSRSYIVQYGNVKEKLPELLTKAGIDFTNEQLLKLNFEITKQKEAIGFKQGDKQ